MTRSIDHTTSDAAAPATPAAARWLALGTTAGAVLFTLAWFVLGFFGTDYTIDGDRVEVSIISQPISGLGMGATAPFMNAAFVASGLLMGAGVFGVFSTTRAEGPQILRQVSIGLLALSGLGLVLAGIFDLGWPLPHLLGFALSVGVPVASFLFAGRYFMAILRWRRFGIGLLIASPVTLLLLVLFQTMFDRDVIADAEGIAGLLSRILASWVLGWFAGMGWQAFRRPLAAR